MKHSSCYNRFIQIMLDFHSSSSLLVVHHQIVWKFFKNSNHNQRDIMQFHHLSKIYYGSKADRYLCRRSTLPDCKFYILLQWTLDLLKLILSCSFGISLPFLDFSPFFLLFDFASFFSAFSGFSALAGLSFKVLKIESISVFFSFGLSSFGLSSFCLFSIGCFLMII